MYCIAVANVLKESAELFMAETSTSPTYVACSANKPKAFIVWPNTVATLETSSPNAWAVSDTGFTRFIVSFAVKPNFINSVCRPIISFAVNLVVPATSIACSFNYSSEFLASSPPTAARLAKALSKSINLFVDSINVVLTALTTPERV